MKGRVLALMVCAVLVTVMVPGEAKAIQVSLNEYTDLYEVQLVGPYAHGLWYFEGDPAGLTSPMIGLKNLPESVYLASSVDGVFFWGMVFNLDNTFQTIITDGVNIQLGPEATWSLGWPAPKKDAPSLIGP